LINPSDHSKTVVNFFLFFIVCYKVPYAPSGVSFNTIPAGFVLFIWHSENFGNWELILSFHCLRLAAVWIWYLTYKLYIAEESIFSGLFCNSCSSLFAANSYSLNFPYKLLSW
jgi:hypothetical protein